MKPSSLLLALLSSCALRPQASDALEQALAAGEFPRTTSVLVERGGETVYEHYFGATDAATLHDPRSVGKSITSLAVGIAIGEGRLPGVEARASTTPPTCARLRTTARSRPRSRSWIC